jgi:hypothetical protein
VLCERPCSLRRGGMRSAKLTASSPSAPSPRSITGNFGNRPCRALLEAEFACNRKALPAKFPAQPNREFLRPEQRITGNYQGIAALPPLRADFRSHASALQRTPRWRRQPMLQRTGNNRERTGSFAQPAPAACSPSRRLLSGACRADQRSAIRHLSARMRRNTLRYSALRAYASSCSRRRAGCLTLSTTISSAASSTV